jgi:hypothetical protein
MEKNQPTHQIPPLPSSSEKSELASKNVTIPASRKAKMARGKKILVTSVILALLALIVAVIFLDSFLRRRSQTTSFLPSSQSKQSLNLSGVISYLKGDVFTLKNGRRVELKVDDLLKEGDQVETGTASRAVVVLDDGSVIRLNEKTTLSLNSLVPQEIEIENRSGSVYSRVKKDKENKFIVKAGAILVESMGTAFSVDHEEEEKVAVMVFESQVKVKKETKESVINEGYKWQEEKTEKFSSEEVEKNEFLKWNFDEDKVIKEEIKLAKVPTPTPTPKPTATPKPTSTPKPQPTATPKKEEPAPVSAIILEGIASMEGIVLEWTLKGIEAPNGFKVIKGTSTNPSYPGDTAVYQSANVRRHVWDLTDGKTYHFRVCKFENGACQVYSNDVAVTAPRLSEEKEEEKEGSDGKLTKITVSVQKIEGHAAKVTWTTEGGSPAGFKVVWSPNSGPVYPPRSGDEWQYHGGGTRESSIIDGLSGVYYFRVCEYSGGCKLYSNQVSVTF